MSDGGRGIGCLVCVPPCEKCRTTNSNDCITCLDKYYISPDDQKTCLDCPERCATCKSPTSCQSNPKNYLIFIIFPLFLGCVIGSYLDGENCFSCIYPCATCLDATYCYTCGYDIENKNGPPHCDCKSDVKP